MAVPLLGCHSSAAPGGGTGADGGTPAGDAGGLASTFDAGPPLPLDHASPWPKFRNDAFQDGVSAVHTHTSGGALWSFPTAKGIFSSPVVGGDGSVYFGSADKTFYALKSERDRELEERER